MTKLRLVQAALLALVLAVVATAAEPKTVLLLGQSRDNHPPGTHEYMSGIERVAKLLAGDDRLRVQVVKADEPFGDGPAMVEKAHGAVLFLSEGARWISADPRRYEAFSRLAERGGGLVALHWAIGSRAAEPIGPFLRLFGGCHGGPDRKYKVVETDLHVTEAGRAILAGMKDFRVRDEFYYQLKFVPGPPTIQPVLEAMIDGRAETVAWSYERPDHGRSFGFSGLHFDDNWQLPEYPQLIAAAVRWTLGLPVQ